MSEKLTLADCFKYPNAHIKSKRKHFFLNVLDYLEWNLQSIETKNLQLTLRSIDQLTDAERKCIDNICGKLSWENWQRSFEGIYTILSNKKTLELFDYLRSINIDIDGFIESGKAVKNETDKS